MPRRAFGSDALPARDTIQGLRQSETNDENTSARPRPVELELRSLPKLIRVSDSAGCENRRAQSQPVERKVLAVGTISRRQVSA
jgi:hypothetical protein